MVIYNKKNCMDLLEKVQLLKEKYKGMYDELRCAVFSSVSSREYSKGALGLHLGYYSPSNEDLYVGGVKRGRLLKSNKSNYEYEYLYDSCGKMICCITCYSGIKTNKTDVFYEFFVQNDDHKFSVEFCVPKLQTPTYITSISLYEFRKKHLTEYVHASSFDGVAWNDIKVEQNEYIDNHLSATLVNSFIPSINTIDSRKYTFKRNEKGQISSYSIEYFNED